MDLSSYDEIEREAERIRATTGEMKSDRLESMLLIIFFISPQNF